MVVLKTNQESMGWTLADEKGTPDTFCTLTIHVDPDPEPIRHPQHRPHPHMMEVFQKEVFKTLNTGVSLIQVALNETRITMAEEDDDDIHKSTSAQNGWKLCIDYRHRNLTQREDHFPPPFTDQRIEGFTGKLQYGFPDKCSGFHKVPPDLEDQEKIALTWPLAAIGHTFTQTLAEETPGVGV